MNFSQPSPLIAIVGPTGSGKSELALRICEEFQGEVVNCDSLQVYRYFNIGTAKLAPEQRRGVPHHLIDILDPDEIFTAGDYARITRPLLGEITARGHIPVVVGGTGFYLRALLDGLFRGPSRDERLRARLAERQQRRPGSLHRILSRLDPEAAKRIHPHDLPKTMRALEVCLIARHPVTEMFARGREALAGFCPLKIGLSPPREELYESLNTRCAQMFESGLPDEVHHILSLGFPAHMKPLESHGYRQALQLLKGELTPKEALFYAQRDTRRYAKRQLTWFRQEANVHWLEGFGHNLQIQIAALDLVRHHLSPAPQIRHAPE